MADRWLVVLNPLNTAAQALRKNWHLVYTQKKSIEQIFYHSNNINGLQLKNVIFFK